ncbi:unnamed protein product [Pedinophyceae sp. YPF-701]|nr:unnamed protein product [Pedinophyceae sp. YPF-701]
MGRKEGGKDGGDGQEEPVSMLVRIRRHFEEQGLSASDIPMAFVYHEATGITLAIAAWAMCWRLQPSKFVVSRLPAGAQTKHARALRAAERAVASNKLLQRLPVMRRDTARATLSLAESIVFRGTIKPVSMPFKLWASYELTRATKRALAKVSSPASLTFKNAATAAVTPCKFSCRKGLAIAE